MAYGAPAGMTGKRVFRSSAARVGGWAWLVFAAANLVDLALHGRDSASAIAAAVLLLGCGIAYVVGLRPRIVADETGVRMHNPLRDVVVPWPALRKITSPDSLRLTFTGPGGEEREARSWVLQASPRDRARADRRAARGQADAIARYLENRTPADFAAEQLTELADTHHRVASTSTGAEPAGADRAGITHGGAGPEPSAGRVNWSASAVAALVGPSLLLAAIALVLVLR
jgi:Bacterial PH domain